VSGGDFSPDLAAANRGPERKFVCYPTGHLGLRLINHTSFRGTEFCVADQFSIYIDCIFFHKRKRFFNRFLKSSGTRLIFISYAVYSGATLPEEGPPRVRLADPSPACRGVRSVVKIRWQTIRQIDLTDKRNSWHTYPLEAALARKIENRSYLY
jgi:hypothetical protein